LLKNPGFIAVAPAPTFSLNPQSLQRREFGSFEIETPKPLAFAQSIALALMCSVEICLLSRIQRLAHAATP
jgi:hypothetical protein